MRSGDGSSIEPLKACGDPWGSIFWEVFGDPYRAPSSGETTSSMAPTNHQAREVQGRAEADLVDLVGDDEEIARKAASAGKLSQEQLRKMAANLTVSSLSLGFCRLPTRTVIRI